MDKITLCSFGVLSFLVFLYCVDYLRDVTPWIRSRLFLADDHTILRAGIRALLENEPDMLVVGEAEDGRSAVKLACQVLPDIVLNGYRHATVEWS